MRQIIPFLLFAAVCLAACNQPEPPVDPDPQDTIPEEPQDTLPTYTDTDDSLFHIVNVECSITRVQPMTGLVFWADQARRKNATYNGSIALEYAYCLPCRVVTGKQDGQIQYDWTYFEEILDDMASRGHQAVIRFRYEYPNSTDVDGQRGTTAVPAYIKAMDGYEETYSADPGGDGPTWYADWRSEELHWFTKQFYTDFGQRYGNDPRIAFLEVGFGHWSEYHIYGTQLQLGRNFPSKEYQKEFLLHVADVMPIPWLISIDAADDYYTPIAGDASLMALRFGLFDDSFMHKTHEIGTSDGYNETCWNTIGRSTRWQTGVCGGEISYYTSSDQRNFLNPDGMYGHTWEEQAAKYHITFMIANDAPSGKYGTAERFLEAGLNSGYRWRVLNVKSSADKTRLRVVNAGVAPLYWDACFAIGDVCSTQSLKGILPNDTLVLEIAAPLNDPDQLHIRCDHTLPTRPIEFETL